MGVGQLSRGLCVFLPSGILTFFFFFLKEGCLDQCISYLANYGSCLRVYWVFKFFFL